MRYGYARISTDDQNLDRHRQEQGIASDEPMCLVARAYGVDEKELRTTLKRTSR